MNPRPEPAGARTYSSAMGDAVGYTRWIFDSFQEFVGSRVVEIGIGHGCFGDYITKRALFVGVDIDEASVKSASLAHPDREYVVADVAAEDFVRKMQNRRFDSVLCINVLEHVQKDSAAIKNMLALLEPGGHLLLFVPAFAALYSSLDSLAGHHRRYTKQSIAMLVPADQAVIVRNDYFNPVGGVGWWLNKFVRHGSLNDRAVNGQVVFFDRYVLPISRILNRVTRAAFGQSIVCVVRKL